LVRSSVCKECAGVQRKTFENPALLVNNKTRRKILKLCSLAPIVIAFNPAFRFQGGEPTRKFTVAQYKLGYVNLREVLRDLSELEPGWGGSPTIGGSPQGVSSKLSLEEVVEVVSCHLLK